MSWHSQVQIKQVKLPALHHICINAGKCLLDYVYQCIHHHQQSKENLRPMIRDWCCIRNFLRPKKSGDDVRIYTSIEIKNRGYLKALCFTTLSTYFCRLLRAPQKRALSGMGNSVLLVGSGLTTFTYVSCPRYHVSRFSALIFQIPTLSSEIKTAVHAPGKTYNVNVHKTNSGQKAYTILITILPWMLHNISLCTPEVRNMLFISALISTLIRISIM